ncbi:hypothetical protein, partial [Shewanella sp. GXUN23E]|uniref:hypothetical protein n=1 Tax=Shewanella sp. GXUN23E TaxID=3422498 RepID=UPI003D7D9829
KIIHTTYIQGRFKRYFSFVDSRLLCSKPTSTIKLKRKLRAGRTGLDHLLATQSPLKVLTCQGAVNVLVYIDRTGSSSVRQQNTGNCRCF